MLGRTLNRNISHEKNMIVYEITADKIKTMVYGKSHISSTK